MIGKTLAQFHIEGRLGAGGMGEVYQARDTRLGRSVAIKVLPELFARDGDRLARFHREAKVLASLNHPGVAALYGFKQSEDTHFLVMELVEGQTLAERIGGKALPVKEALDITRQIVEALEAAHEKGVIHRNLKPANVKITPDGKVKVLDFGLAKAMDGSPAVAVAGQSPTLSLGVSQAGVILGTAGYMSPEQARGATADRRSDMFSVGCVLYEMLTGVQPFQAETVPEILAGVLARDPNLGALPANLNPRIVDLLRRCLDKNPKNRWHAAGDLRIAIEQALEDPRGLIVGPETVVSHGPLWRRAVPVLLSAIAGAAVAVAIVWALRPSPETDALQFRFQLPEGQTFASLETPAITISPDGLQFAYAASGRIYLRKMNEFQSTPIPGSEVERDGPANIVFSPDGQWIAFSSGGDNTIKRIPIGGGKPTIVCRAENVQGMSWGDDDQIVFGQGAKGIMQVAATSGTPTTIVTVESGEEARNPQRLPGGAILFTVAKPASNAPNAGDVKLAVVAQPTGSSPRKTIVEGASDARYLPAGHLVYAIADDLMAVPFNASRLEQSGDAFPISEPVYANGRSGTLQLSASNTGTLAYVSRSSARGTIVEFVDRKNKTEPVPLPPGEYRTPRLSPDQNRIAIVRRENGIEQIFIYNIDESPSVGQLTRDGSNTAPVWMDDERIIFRSSRLGRGNFKAYWQRADGTGQVERIDAPETGNPITSSWDSASGTLLLTSVKDPDDDNNVWSYSIRKKQTTELVPDKGRQQNAAFAPNGRWLAYQSDETGQNEIYVQPYPPRPPMKLKISRSGGSHPAWSPDGKEVFFVNGGHLFSVEITLEPSLAASPNPVGLEIGEFIQGAGGARNYDIASDGRFVAVRPSTSKGLDTTPPSVIEVATDWLGRLKTRSPQ